MLFVKRISPQFKKNTFKKAPLEVRIVISWGGRGLWGRCWLGTEKDLYGMPEMFSVFT